MGFFPNRTLRAAGKGGPATRPYGVGIGCLIPKVRETGPSVTLFLIYLVKSLTSTW